MSKAPVPPQDEQKGDGEAGEGQLELPGGAFPSWSSGTRKSLTRCIPLRLPPSEASPEPGSSTGGQRGS